MEKWQEDLKNKFNQSKKEEKNDIISSGNNNRSSDSIRSSVSNQKGKDINNNDKEKGGKRMITVDAALKDLEEIETEATDAGAKTVVKALKVIVKFLSTIRSNQLLTDTDRVRIQKAKTERQSEKKA